MPDESRDDLRRRINELEATVDGLTQEVVEATERIRHLEEDAEAVEEAATADEPTGASTDTESEDEEAEDDIIVA